MRPFFVIINLSNVECQNVELWMPFLPLVEKAFILFLIMNLLIENYRNYKEAKCQ